MVGNCQENAMEDSMPEVAAGQEPLGHFTVCIHVEGNWGTRAHSPIMCFTIAKLSLQPRDTKKLAVHCIVASDRAHRSLLVLYAKANHAAPVYAKSLQALLLELTPPAPMERQ